MICQRCKEKEATVQLTKIANGSKTEIHLCEECAGKETLNLYHLDFTKFLNGFLNIENETESLKKNEERDTCNNCGMSFEEFKKTGKMGCDVCYESFSEHLEPLIKKIHGRTVHTGKIAKTGGHDLKMKRELSEMQKNLEEAINDENYELAAEYRDIIRLLKGSEEVKTNEEKI